MGCSSFSSIQEVENGHVFFAYDGFYFYDGINSTKISDRINATILGYNSTNFPKIRSLAQRNKHRIWWTFTSSGQTTNDKIVVWDYYNNAWSVYDGITASSLATFLVSGIDERPYFQDYTGRVYRGDTGNDDYPANSQTAIDAYYWTNWRAYGDAVNQKAVPHVYCYYTDNSSMLNFSYAYDFNDGSVFSQTFDMSVGSATWDNVQWDEFQWTGSGGSIRRLDLTGRGRTIRFKFANNLLNQPFRIDGFGQLGHLETNV